MMAVIEAIAAAIFGRLFATGIEAWEAHREWHRRLWGALRTLRRSHAPADAHEDHGITLTRGERIAERVTGFVGSWPYICGQALFLLTWFSINTIPFLFHFDPWPWMGANIIMSALAAFATSFVLIAQAVSARRDRALWKMMGKVLHHVEKTAEADHVEHGRLLREIHAAVVGAKASEPPAA